MEFGLSQFQSVLGITLFDSLQLILQCAIAIDCNFEKAIESNETQYGEKANYFHCSPDPC